MSDSRRRIMKAKRPIVTNGHEYIDLDLPSGTLWATTNVGANSEIQYGNYYKYGYGATQYSADTSQSYYTGNEDPLDSSKDTATQVWGGDWHMPTYIQAFELCNNTIYQYTTINGVAGGKFMSKEDSTKYIFLPAGGFWYEGDQNQLGQYGYYLCSTPYLDSKCYISFIKSSGGPSVASSVGRNGYGRVGGNLVRPVITI